ncbi:SusD/RagB family nutrient-binding outer membrane lipoprotein [Sphingobacterium psychroaquaticum]|uniref:Starch-binding associating with outer membrane n=1 Tax=Sphingobacterium psychroaquaticum TaxID=561061 RepID=A0A1X7KRU1_9SPHI|nr:SusD/RagB family nutrient-binding outer membrane lipoprotein [Sphingobacterium psychroaquaticum]SMG44265.1 Starch-binding associating with outer membrane [Sphingobacterium psychroaquaticum]
MKAKSIITVFIACCLTTVSCNKFGDTNIDPTRSSDLDPSLQLTNTQLRFSGDLESNEKVHLCLTMPIVQHVGGIWANRWGQMYIYNRQYLSSLWDFAYRSGVVNMVSAVERTANDPEQSNLNAVCRIMKVYEFARLTDMYGDIPYSEAGKAYIDRVTRPKFDRQEDIYNDFFTELKAAAEQLDPSKDQVRGDLFYKGDIESWKKFANSLRLRYAMRLVKINPDKARQETAAAFEAGVFTSNADICLLHHEDIQNTYADMRGNGLSAAIGQSEVLPRVSRTLVEQLQSTNDPRMPHFLRYYIDIINRPFDRIDITEQVKAQIGYYGVKPTDYIWDDWLNPMKIQLPNGKTIEIVNNDQKVQLANFLIRNNAPFLHMTYAEVSFLLAEASVRWGGNWGGTAATHYANGMRASIKHLSLYPGGPNIEDQQINTFIQGNSLIPGREIELINKQLWITFLMNGTEAFANWRRTGFPALTPGLTGESTTNQIPRRLEYPINETEQNRANVAPAIEALGPGGDTWTNRVWWDKP